MEELDTIKRYGLSMGWLLKPRTVLVEGTTDVELFELAARLELKKSGKDLLEGITIIAAGVGGQGGTKGVIRELSALRLLSRTCLTPNGKPIYRFIGLFDNDIAGRKAVQFASYMDTTIKEYKDVFRLQPIMPTTGNLDPKTLQKTFERLNENYKQLDWELEDLVEPEFFDAFLGEYPSAIFKNKEINGKVHRDMTKDCKARFHKFIKDNAIYQDLTEVINVLKAIRFYLAMGEPKPTLGFAQ